MRHTDTHRDTPCAEMVLLTTSDVCLYLFVALSTITLMESLIALFILIAGIEESKTGLKEGDQDIRSYSQDDSPEQWDLVWTGGLLCAILVQIHRCLPVESKSSYSWEFRSGVILRTN